MSHIDRGILGPIHGNIATVNGYSYYGRDFIRSRIVAKLDARTSSQLLVRSGFKSCSDFLKPIYYSIIAQTFSYIKFDITNWFFFFKQNLRFFHGAGVVDYQDLFISQGNLDIAPDFRMTNFYVSIRLQLRWTNSWDNVNSFPDDVLNGFVFNLTKNESFVLIDNTPRNVGSSAPYMPSHWQTDDVLKIYAYFITSDVIRICDNMFAFWDG